MFLNSVLLVLIEAIMFPGAKSYSNSNENHITTTARACTAVYVIMEG